MQAALSQPTTPLTPHSSQNGGMVLHLQRLSTEDGPGIRTTVFFKGCSLRCAWCHNPESMSGGYQLQWLETRCIGCDTCLNTCQRLALRRTPDGLQIDRSRCNGCGLCSEACPSNALERLGSYAETDWLVKQLLKDRAYYEKSGGGVTLSGGEPTRQPQFAEALLRRLKEDGIHTALDTCGLCPTESLERLLPYTDLVLYDLKEFDPDRHYKYTGASNERILGNLLWLANELNHLPSKKLWIRTPLIPGATFTEENLKNMAQWMGNTLGETVERWELCAFNNLCRDKYRRLGFVWQFSETPLLTKADMDQALTWANSGRIDYGRIFVTGAARVAESVQ
jgi:pyruvate formate lyase activating enzyme